MAFKNKIVGLDGKAYFSDEICRYNFISIGGSWQAGKRLTDEELHLLKTTGKSYKDEK